MGYKQLDQMNQEEKQETVINEKSLLLVTSHIPMNQHFGVRALDAFQKKVSREGYRVEIEIVTEEEMRMNQVLEEWKTTELMELCALKCLIRSIVHFYVKQKTNFVY